MTEEKIMLIDKICTLHPSLGVDKRWSEYTGGMKDSGDWYFRKMLDVPIEELQEFYDMQVYEKSLWVQLQAKEKEEFKASGMTLHEWNKEQFRKMFIEIQKKMAQDVFVNLMIDGKLVIPKPNKQ